MEASQTLFLFLYALFWAQVLATTPRYNAFPTAKLWAGPESVTYGDRRIWASRLAVSLLLLNFSPILWLIFLYKYVVPATFGNAEIAVAALSSQSIFGILRIYHGVVGSKDTVRLFFTKEEDELLIHGPTGRLLSAWSHIVPGALYLLLFPGLAMLVRWLWL
jgi:hypothetical protein